jgi:transposase
MDEVDALRREELLLLVRDLLQVNAEQQARILRLEEEVARLKGGGPPSDVPREAPAFVKPNRKPKHQQEKRPRKQRPHGFARKRETPTRVLEHYPENCSECGRKLAGGWLHASRQVLEIPIAPFDVVEHRFMARHCGVCDRREFARPDLSSQVRGQSRLGVRLMSFISYLDTVCRMPIAGIKRLLVGLYHLHLSEGEIVRVLHAVAEAGERAYAGLLSEARQSGVLHADETGAREDGVNGYVWSLCTPNLRYYHREASRSASVIQGLLGYDPAVFEARSAKNIQKLREANQTVKASRSERFRGVLVSDFYAAYSWYSRSGGWHQRCLVHLDRDLDDLKEAHARDPAVCEWVGKVLDLIQRSKDIAVEHATDTVRFPVSVRRKHRQAFEKEAEELARPYCRSALPQRVLAERLMKHRSELFVFVHHPDVPSDNNAAERAIRPFVVLRKVSGGTRSAAGSHTQAVLLSLFGTWQVRGQDALAECRHILSRKPESVTT